MDSLQDVIIEQRESLVLLQNQLTKLIKYNRFHYRIGKIGKDGAIKRFITTRCLFKKPYDYWKPVFNAEAYVKYNTDVSIIFGDSKKIIEAFHKSRNV